MQRDRPSWANGAGTSSRFRWGAQCSIGSTGGRQLVGAFKPTGRSSPGRIVFPCHPEKKNIDRRPVVSSSFPRSRGHRERLPLQRVEVRPWATEEARRHRPTPLTQAPPPRILTKHSGATLAASGAGRTYLGCCTIRRRPFSKALLKRKHSKVN